MTCEERGLQPPNRKHMGRLFLDRGNVRERLPIVAQFICDFLQFDPDDQNLSITQNDLLGVFGQNGGKRYDSSGDVRSLYELMVLCGAEECWDGSGRVFIGAGWRNGTPR